jgi:hypothetical protein
VPSPEEVKQDIARIGKIVYELVKHVVFFYDPSWQQPSNQEKERLDNTDYLDQLNAKAFVKKRIRRSELDEEDGVEYVNTRSELEQYLRRNEMKTLQFVDRLFQLVRQNEALLGFKAGGSKVGLHQQLFILDLLTYL